MNSPITGKPMRLVTEKNTLEFRKEKFEIIHHFYECVDTGEAFTDELTGDLNLYQVYNAYRAKHKIPFPEEIKRIRSQYNLPATTMSAILGLGVNQYGLYENGEIPSETNARLIQMAANPDDFLRLIELSDAIENGKKEKLLKHIAVLKESRSGWNIAREKMLGVNAPSEYTGYKKAYPEKVYHMLRFFADSLSPLKTAMNKLLFYADFYHFKRYASGISGLQYKAIQWGPVPSQFDYLFRMAEENNIINLKYEVWDGDKEMVVIDPSPDTTFRPELFTEDEMNSLQTVLGQLKGLKTKSLVEISHKEPAWKENIGERKLISYKYAFGLQAI